MTAPTAPTPRDIAALDVPAVQVAADAWRLLRDRLPLGSALRHDMDDPAVEAASAQLMAEHPEWCTPANDWTPGGAS